MGLRMIDYDTKMFDTVKVSELKEFINNLDDDVELFVGVGDTLSRLVDIQIIKPIWSDDSICVCFVDRNYLEESCMINKESG